MRGNRGAGRLSLNFLRCLLLCSAVLHLSQTQSKITVEQNPAPATGSPASALDKVGHEDRIRPNAVGAMTITTDRREIAEAFAKAFTPPNVSNHWDWARKAPDATPAKEPEVALKKAPQPQSAAKATPVVAAAAPVASANQPAKTVNSAPATQQAESAPAPTPITAAQPTSASAAPAPPQTAAEAAPIAAPAALAVPTDQATKPVNSAPTAQEAKPAPVPTPQPVPAPVAPAVAQTAAKTAPIAAPVVIAEPANQLAKPVDLTPATREAKAAPAAKPVLARAVRVARAAKGRNAVVAVPLYYKPPLASATGSVPFVLHFPFNIAAARAAPSAEHEALVSLLRSKGKLVRAMVIGHADIRGSRAYNKKLSLKRARSVCRLLRKQTGQMAGIVSPMKKISAMAISEPLPCESIGAGVDHPLGGSYAADRRAEIYLFFEKTAVSGAP